MTIDETIACPGCGEQMERRVDPDVTVDVCPGCRGLFLDEGELNVLATGHGGDIEFSSIDDDDHDDVHGVRRCPRCRGNAMDKVNLLNLSSIIFDHCESCGGFFLDRGELEATNRELASISHDGRAEELRERLGVRLLRVDRAEGTTSYASGGKGRGLRAVGVFHLVVSLYLHEPLGLGLHARRMTLRDRLARFFLADRREDITLDDDAFGQRVIVAGDNVSGILSLFGDAGLRREIVAFLDEPPRVHGRRGELEILDERVACVLGPFSDSTRFEQEVRELTRPAWEALQRLAREIEAAHRGA